MFKKIKTYGARKAETIDDFLTILNIREENPEIGVESLQRLTSTCSTIRALFTDEDGELCAITEFKPFLTETINLSGKKIEISKNRIRIIKWN